ncbi:MAG TPA: flagellar export chaperone FlgN [Solirubrobacteraceae bacterium]|nr:flagellar export chaperone FlgN [Solirubrobacteraceae bacterium]
MTAAPIAGDILAHLEAQLGSARRLLAQVLRQSGAIRCRDVDGVLATMTDIQGEMAARGRLESERTQLLWRAGSMLGIPAEAVTLAELTGLMDDDDADEARTRSAELRGMLAEVEREHAINRALMRQELAFVEHLTRMLGGMPQSGGYGPDPGARAAARQHSPHHVVDYEA